MAKIKLTVEKIQTDEANPLMYMDLGISKERMDELEEKIDQVIDGANEHNNSKSDNQKEWLSTMEVMARLIDQTENENEALYMSFIFGNIVAQNQSKMDMLKQLMSQG